ncbi:MAG: hypothetical protein ABIJ26_02330 [Candidatus Margulisiibacteriota bacterium]|nr:hypothetical protein [Candidatus Margulisiibacteriota bacterium]
MKARKRPKKRKKKLTDKEIQNNIRWFSKFPLEKRLTLAFEQIKGINVLRKLKPQS